MKETTLDTATRERVELSGSDRFGAWLYTGAPGRLASFSIDLGLTFAALGLYGARQAAERIRTIPRS
jgi:hypothetical protein